MSDLTPIHHSTTAQRLYDEAQEHLERGDFTTARHLHQQALALREQHPGPDHPDTARSMNAVASVLLEQGEFPAARELIERALVIQQPALGNEHLDTAHSLNNLGITLFVLGDLRRGRHLVEQAYTIRTRLLGNEHPDTIESMNNLGIILNRLGERDRALHLHQQALAICERVFGEQHRKTIESLNYIAVKLAAHRSTYTHALHLYERALASSEAVLGTAHPLTLQLLNNLGAVLADLGEHAVAQGTLERSLTLHEQVLGLLHPGTAYVLINLGDVCTRQHAHTSARLLYERALVIREQVHGPFHLDTINALEKLLTCLGNLSPMSDPLDPTEHYLTTDTMYQSIAGPLATHSDAMLNALELYPCLMALKAATGTLPPTEQHMPGANTAPEQAAVRLRRIVERLAAKHTGPSHPDEEHDILRQAVDIEAQSDRLFNEDDIPAAQALLEQALALREQIQGQYHMDQIKLLRKLIVAARAQGRLTTIQPLLERITETHVQALGEDHTATLQVLHELAMFYTDEYGYNSPRARRMHERIQQIMLRSLGSNDPHVQLISNVLEQISASSIEDDEAYASDEARSARWERALTTLRENPPTILADIATIDWGNLRHAYGSAGDVPELLMLLLSEDEIIREDVYEELYGNICHQGTIYEASAYAVPFLLRLLDYPGTPDKGSILHLLTSLAEGSSYLTAHHWDEGSSEWHEMLAKEGEDFDTELSEELSWVAAVQRAVGVGIDSYLRLLEDATLREDALNLLAVLQSHSSVIVPHLLALLPTTSDTRFRAQIVQTLGIQMDHSEGTQQFFNELLQQNESENITYLAAIALVQRAREYAPAAAVENIVATIRRLSSSPEAQFGIRNAVESLIPLGATRAFPVLLQIVPLLQTQEAAEHLAGILLDLAFNAGEIRPKSCTWSSDQWRRPKHTYSVPAGQPRRDPATLTELQRTLLHVLVAHDPLWEITSNLFMLYGLPTTREQVRAFAAV